MRKMPPMIAVSEFRDRHRQVFGLLDDGPVLVAARSKPEAVMVRVNEWNRIADELEELRQFKVTALIHARANEVIERNDANNSWVSQDELLKRLEKSHGPEYIAAIKEGIVDEAG